MGRVVKNMSGEVVNTEAARRVFALARLLLI